MATKSSSEYAHSESQGEPNRGRGRHFLHHHDKRIQVTEVIIITVFCGGNLLFGYNWTAVTVIRLITSLRALFFRGD